MRILFVIILLIIAVNTNAQDTSKKKIYPDTTTAINFGGKFIRVEIESVYPGGQEAWARFLQANLHYPDKAVRKKIQGTVVVQFIVDKNGAVSDIEAISGPDNGGLKEEAVRVIKISGNWIPAVQDGRKVRSYKKQPISFRLD